MIAHFTHERQEWDVRICGFRHRGLEGTSRQREADRVRVTKMEALDALVDLVASQERDTVTCLGGPHPNNLREASKVVDLVRVSEVLDKPREPLGLVAST